MLPLSAASLLIKEASGAAGETRTPTGFNPLAPQASASTNSATAATGPGELPKNGDRMSTVNESCGTLRDPS